MSKHGALALVLHSHMPYVEGFGTWPFGEEWLFEAISTVYLPLVELFERWAEQGRKNVLTLGLTPVLCDQLELPAVDERLRAFLKDVRLPSFAEDARGLRQSGMEAPAAVLDGLSEDYKHVLASCQQAGPSLLERLNSLTGSGMIELWTSAATHAVLPLLATEPGRRLQVKSGVSSHLRRFGSWQGGFWLPECAYQPGLESLLAEAGATAFCVDQSSHIAGLDLYEPVATTSGPIAVPIDWSTVELVWSDTGYPANREYRDYHAQTINGLRPWRNSGGPYDRRLAARLAQQHAQDFLKKVARQLESYRAERGRSGLLTCALDTELLGHWWFEGQVWLAAVVEQADQFGIELTTLPTGLESLDPTTRPLHASTWGTDKDLSTWDCARTAEIVWQARQAELALLLASKQMLKAGITSDRLRQQPAFLRACRELLALQSSDWAFMAQRELAADYPDNRARSHSHSFALALSELLDHGDLPSEIGAQLRGLALTLASGSLFEPASATLIS